MGMIYRPSTYKPKRKKKAPQNPAAKFSKPFSEKVVREDPWAWRRTGPVIPSLGDGIGNATVKAVPKYQDPELQAREAAAQQHSEYLKKCVAPAFNKGAYTLIASEEQAKWVGRK